MRIVSRLHAIEDIRRLRAEFFLYVDRKQWDALRMTFTPDAVIDYNQTRSAWRADAPPGPESVDDFIQSVATMLADAVTIHHIFSPIIDILSPTQAEATWRVQDLVVRGPGTDRSGGLGFGLYEDRYRRTEDGWQISSVVFTRLLVLPLAGHHSEAVRLPFFDDDLPETGNSVPT